jgi:hypothetical protein
LEDGQPSLDLEFGNSAQPDASFDLDLGIVHINDLIMRDEKVVPGGAAVSGKTCNFNLVAGSANLWSYNRLRSLERVQRLVLRREEDLAVGED